MTAFDIAWGYTFGCLAFGTWLCRDRIRVRWIDYRRRARVRASDRDLVRRMRSW